MKQTFYSRVGAFVIITNILALFIVWLPLILKGIYEVQIIVISAIVSFFLLSMTFGIKYVVDGGKLKIYTLFFHTDIDIKCITRMERSRSLLSAPAASLNRLALYYGKGNVTYISPRRQDEFIALLNAVAEKEIPFNPS